MNLKYKTGEVPIILDKFFCKQKKLSSEFNIPNIYSFDPSSLHKWKYLLRDFLLHTESPRNLNI